MYQELSAIVKSKENRGKLNPIEDQSPTIRQPLERP